MKYLGWVEPREGINKTDAILFCKMTEADAIAVQRHRAFESKGFEYSSDQAALDDFIGFHCATYIK